MITTADVLPLPRPGPLEELSETVVRFVSDLDDVIDRMQCRSEAGYLDEVLLRELAAILEDRAWEAVAAYELCCQVVTADTPPPAVLARVGRGPIR